MGSKGYCCEMIFNSCWNLDREVAVVWVKKLYLEMVEEEMEDVEIRVEEIEKEDERERGKMREREDER